jgi:hypothetical protein
MKDGRELQLGMMGSREGSKKKKTCKGACGVKLQQAMVLQIFYLGEISPHLPKIPIPF